MAFGLALFLLAWLPIALIRSQGLSPRMFYFPLVGVILFLAALLDGLLSILPVGHGKIPVRGPQPPKERGWGAPTALGAGLGLVCIAGAVGQVGTQSALRHRYALDQQEMARLKEMIPQPCTEAVLMPMDIQNMAAATGYLVFDNFATGGFAAGWSAVAMVQHSYQRNDVFATSCLYDDPLPLSDFSARGAHCAYPLASFELLPAGGCIILLSRMYPFSVDVNGQVNLVDELIIDRIGEAAVRLPVPQTHALVAAQKLSAKAIWVQESSPAVGLESLTDWQWAATGEHVPFLNRVEWGTTLPATLLRGTSPQSNRRSGVKTVLPASLSDLDLFFRVTLKEADVRQGIGDDAAVLFYLGSAPGPPNAKYRVWGGPQSPQTRLELRRDLIRNDRHWLACTIRVPAHSELLELHAEAQVLSNAPRSCGICLTPGHFKIGSHEDTPPPSRN